MLLPTIAVPADFRSPFPPPSPAFRKYIVPTVLDDLHSSVRPRIPRRHRQAGGDAPSTSSPSRPRHSFSFANPRSPSAWLEFSRLPPPSAMDAFIEHLSSDDLMNSPRQLTTAMCGHLSSFLHELSTERLLNLRQALNVAVAASASGSSGGQPLVVAQQLGNLCSDVDDVLVPRRQAAGMPQPPTHTFTGVVDADHEDGDDTGHQGGSNAGNFDDADGFDDFGEADGFDGTPKSGGVGGCRCSLFGG